MNGEMWLAAGLAAAGYVVGSIPFGVLVSRILGCVDPRTAGSRNIGFTNVLRVSGKKAGILTLIGDAGKGVLVAAVGSALLADPSAVFVVALSPILGHLYSVFLSFKGGKGVATAMGAVGGVSLPMGLVLLGIWLGTVAWVRISSAGAIAAFASLPVVALLMTGSWEFVGFGTLVSLLVLWRHRENMARLARGVEPRIGRSRTS